ncbi:MAG: hypothetical protein CM1200mP17_12820 [Woeseia sp.]|nr:MAG: hypothetical protein CM1200mP17_12820 [Woeseia sp.]
MSLSPIPGEQALEITDMLVASGAVDLIVIDSVAALTPRAEIEGDMGDTHVGFSGQTNVTSFKEVDGKYQKKQHHGYLFSIRSE